MGICSLQNPQHEKCKMLSFFLVNLRTSETQQRKIWRNFSPSYVDMCILMFQANDNNDNTFNETVTTVQHAHVFYLCKEIFFSLLLLLLSFNRIKKNLTKMFLCCEKFVEFVNAIFHKTEKYFREMKFIMLFSNEKMPSRRILSWEKLSVTHI